MSTGVVSEEFTTVIAFMRFLFLIGPLLFTDFVSVFFEGVESIVSFGNSVLKVRRTDWPRVFQ